MYLTYIDESGDTGVKPGSSRHLLLGAAVLFEGQWTYVKRDIDALIAKYFPTAPSPREIHCTDLRGGRDEFAKLPRPQRDAMLDEFCQLTANMLPVELRMFSVIYDKAEWRARNPGKTGDDLYLEAFEVLVSRVDLFLRRCHAEGRPSKTLMIVDPHSSAMSTALKRALGSFQSGGTKWGNLYNVIEAVMFLGSHESPGLQLADLCSYAVWRLVEYGDPKLALQLVPAFDREPFSSNINAGKWHGVKYFGSDPKILTLIRTCWA